jgi:dinuclear metal center YbgI/SA1388 family protein
MSESIKNIISILETYAPLSYQESYDNAGLQIGDVSKQVTSVIVCIDITEEVIDEAIAKGAGLIVSHHPLLFGGIKKITGKSYVERCIIKAIQNNIAIYSAHTNLDAVNNGVNAKIAQKIGLTNLKPLSPIHGDILKLVTFVPEQYADNVRTALFEAGAGSIGNYDCCSFNSKGEGTFRGNELSNPFVGTKGQLHIEPEIMIESIMPKHLKNKVIQALKTAHPYEEVAYDIYQLDNENPLVGIGLIGELSETIDEKEFLQNIKKGFNVDCLRHTTFLNKKVKRVVVCGGSGSSYLKYALSAKADVFITGDFKYHEFFNAENKILIADIGHYESEFFTKELFYDILTKNNTNFAVHLTDINTNPIKYL